MASRTAYAGIATGALALLGLYFASEENYLLFHTLAEMFSIIVAVGIFGLAWLTRRSLGNNYLLFIGIAYLSVAGFDLLHTLSYTGMGVFTGYGTNLATQLWVSARYIESLSLVVAPLLIGRRLNAHLAFLGYAVVSSLLLTSIFAWEVFPEAYAEGLGLTTFKRGSEYAISAVLLGAAFLLYRRREVFEPTVFRLLLASILVTVSSEMAFTLYTDPFAPANFAGHVLKIISFYLIYRAIIETGLVRPYDLLLGNLQEREQALRQTGERYALLVGNLAEAVLSIREGVVIWCNESVEKVFGYGRDELTGREASFLFPDSPSPPVFIEEVSGNIKEHGVYISTARLRRKDGSWVDVEYSVSQLPETNPPELIAVARDVSERKRAEEELRLERNRAQRYLDVAGVILVAIDRHQKITLINQKGCAVLGYSEEEIIGKNWFDTFVPPDVRSRVREAFDRLMAGEIEPVEYFENPVLTKEGGERTMAWYNTVLRDEQGAIAGTLSSGEDITERRQAQEALSHTLAESQRRREEMSALLEGSRAVLASQQFPDVRRTAGRISYLSWSAFSRPGKRAYWSCRYNSRALGFAGSRLT
jgi:PAS domain S-box-containing protein